MATKPTPKPKSKGATANSVKPAAPQKPVKLQKDNAKKPEAPLVGWLQDASIEAPTPPAESFVPGQREMEFSVGLRQQETDAGVRSELRGRALVHINGQVLALIEASYVTLSDESRSQRPDLPGYLYSQLKPCLEGLLALAGHEPPLPEGLEQVS